MSSHAMMSGNSFTQWQVLGMSSHAMTSSNSFAQLGVLGMSSHAMMGGNSFAQWQFPVGFLFLVGDVLYGRAHGGGIWIWATKDNPPNGGSNSVYIC